MKYLILFFVFSTKLVLSQGNATFYLIFNDSKLIGEDIKRKVNFLIENSEAKKTKFEIVHFSNKSEEYTSWQINKSTVNYKPTRKGCDFDICKNLSGSLSITRTDKSKLFLSDKKLNCDFGIESVQMSNTDESTVIDKLNEEITRIKDLKSIHTTYFFFNGDQLNSKPSLKFENDKIKVKESETIRLAPIVTGEIVDYSWSPQIGLSCSNCPNPELKASESKTYTLTVTDSSGCNSLSASINIEVEKNCLCEKDLSKVEIQFGKVPIKKFEKKVSGLTAEWEWRVISNQSGGYVFDLVTNPNCAKKFRVKVIRKNGREIFDQIYNREDVDNRSKMPYHEKYPDKFVFRINLEDEESRKLIEDTENEPYFLVEIVSIDDFQEECDSIKYISPKIRWTKCN